MSNFTPGPWTVYTPLSIDRGATYGVDSESGCAVVWFGSSKDDGIRSLADATLIAAAPDLLRELQSLVGVLWPAEPATTADGCYTDDPKEKGARAAISKALGMSSPNQLHKAPQK